MATSSLQPSVILSERSGVEGSQPVTFDLEGGTGRASRRSSCSDLEVAWNGSAA
ncbi:hypothetical protein [Rubrivirga sp.]|uniref:hypothetical protein n=1 Tax=Rubrivirga sp. TaxID=1885344 RepID=UPI003C7789B6